MRRLDFLSAIGAVLMMNLAAYASDAETSATAASHNGQPNGTAAATAHYEGERGFARTDTRSGSVSLARGVAVGVDANGLSLSVSQALAGRFGLALATNFNMSIGTDGRVSTSSGLTVSNGTQSRSATAGGQTSTARGGSGAVSYASGKTDAAGTVVATTRAADSGVHVKRVAREPSVRTARPIPARTYAR